jgi:hypothetical protein
MKRDDFIEGFEYVRMKFRKEDQLNRKDPGHEELPLKRGRVREEEDVWSPYGTCHVA